MFLPRLNISFEWPFFAFFFLLAFLYQERSQALYAFRLPFFKSVQAAALPLRGRFSFLKYLAALFLTLALMRPVMYQGMLQRPLSGRSVMLVLDTSGSMGEEDVTIAGRRRMTRMSAVKQVVAKFIEERGGDLVGIVLFGTRGYQYVPLTYDLPSALDMLSEVDVGLAGTRTAIGDGLGVALKSMESWKQPEKIVVLLSDGVENAGVLRAEQAARVAKDKQVRVYTIGLGKPDRYSSQGFDEAVLKDMAKTTGGRYYNASNLRNLEAIYAEINRLEPAEPVLKSYRFKKELFYYPLFAAIFFILIGRRRGIL